jgi:hypothetical protein
MVLLAGESITGSENSLFHTEDEIMELLNPINGIVEETEVNKTFYIELKEIIARCCIIFHWSYCPYLTIYLCIVLVLNSLSYTFQITKDGQQAWKREFTDVDDIQDVEKVQVIPVKVEGEWYFGNRKTLFMVNYWKEVDNSFNIV